MRRCLFCDRPFPVNGVFEHARSGRRIAFDAGRGRLWAVCDGCFRWSLVPLEDRQPALEELERAARDRGRPVARTAHVLLLDVDGVLLVRVGDASLAEQSWWRYGRELRRRRASYDSRAARLSAYTFGAMAFVADVMGVRDTEIPIDWRDAPIQDILRWRRFGWAAWHGRVHCPFCHSTLRALRYDLSWWVYPLPGEDGHMAVGVPCPRCDPWTPEHVYRIEGPQAENVLRRCLAYQNIAGAPEGVIHDAARIIDDAGSPGEFAALLGRRRQSLWRLGSTGGVALEIALGESVESRLMDLEVRAVEFLWRREEALARIIDEELTP